MTSSFFDDIDVDLNHFENLYPNLIHNRNNQYYDDDRFNSTLASNDCVRDLSVVHLNIRSINANGSDFITYLSLLNRKFDVVCLSETFVTDLILANNLFDDYESFHSIQSENSHGGGVAIYIKKELLNFTSVIQSRTVNCDYIESVFVKVTFSNKCTIIGCCYRPPASNKDRFLSFCDENFSRLNTNINDIIISGDFNLCMLRATDNNQLASFYENMNSYSLIPTILQPTRFDDRTCSLIDKIFVSNYGQFTSGLLRTNISDHFPIFIIYRDYYLNANKSPETITYRLINENTLDRLYYSMLNEDLLNYNALSIDDHLETLHNRLLKNFHDSCPIRTKLISPKDKLKPWINNELKVYMKRRDNFFQLKENKFD